MQPPISYDIIRSKRKTMALQVTTEGAVIVRAPHYVSQRQIADFVAKNHAWIVKKQAAYQDHTPTPPPSEDEWRMLITMAKETLPDRVAYFSALMGVTPTAVKITRAESRFGSCSGKNSICFSALLMRYPPAAIDYVVVHELAHITHKNHGANFWATVAAVLPDYKERKKLLRG